MIHLQGIPLAPKTRKNIQELQGRTVVYPPSESISSNKDKDSNQECALFKRAFEEWFNRRLAAEGYKYIQRN